MNGLRRGYRRSETGIYRNLLNEKYNTVPPKRDWLNWRNRPSGKQEHHPMIVMLILLLIMVGCFASALICTLPFRLIFH
jgi:hypothetical protein